MASALSKEELKALFSAAKAEAEEEVQFPLTMAFIERYFKANVLAQAKSYLMDDQIAWCEHSDDFLQIKAEVLGNRGNRFHQQITIRDPHGAPKLDAQCTCRLEQKCKHLAAVILKLKQQTNDLWQGELPLANWFEQQTHNPPALPHAFHVIFVLSDDDNCLVLSPRLAQQDEQGVFGGGKALSHAQLTAHTVPKGMSEEDHKLVALLYSQAQTGRYLVEGEIGFELLKLLAHKARLFYRDNRVPITFCAPAALEHAFSQMDGRTQLTVNPVKHPHWLLGLTSPCTFYSPNANQLGVLQTSLHANHVQALNTMPDFKSSQRNDVERELAKIYPSLFATQQQLALHVSYSQEVVTLSGVPKAHHLLFSAFGFSPCKGALQLICESRYYAAAVVDALAEDSQHVLGGADFNVTKAQNQAMDASLNLVLSLDDKRKLKCDANVVFQGLVIAYDDMTLLEHALLGQSQTFVYLSHPLMGVVRVNKAAYVCLRNTFNRVYGAKKQPKVRALPLSSLDEFKAHALELEFANQALVNLDKLLSGEHNNAHIIPHEDFKGTLRPYQSDAITWLWRLYQHQLGGVLADDMGLGKTVQTLAFLSRLVAEGAPSTKPQLIVAPTSVIGNWQSEIARFLPNVHVQTYVGQLRNQQVDSLANADIVLTSYPILGRDADLFSQLEWDCVVLDEAQHVKNQGALVTKSARRLQADFRLALSGTPVENHLIELKSLFDFILPGLLGTDAQFKRDFVKPLNEADDQQVKAKLTQLISPFVMRREKALVAPELPEKTIATLSLPMLDEQAKVYQAILQKVVASVDKHVQENGVAKSQLIFLEALTKLRQASVLPSLADHDAPQSSAKFSWLLEHVPELVNSGRRIIIFSQFASALPILQQQLSDVGIETGLLTGKTRDRDNQIQRFVTGTVPVFLISLKAGGTGLNLTTADTVIHLDPWWNPAVEAQATDRAYRIGQENKVMVYKLIAQNTVEAQVLNMQAQKSALADSLFNVKNHDFSQFDQRQLINFLKS